MNNRIIPISICFSLLTINMVSANSSLPGKLKESHPRIILTDAQISALKKNVKHNSLAADYLKKLRKHADSIMDEKPVERILKGPRLLYVSRKVLDRVTTLGLLYRLDNDPKLAARAIKEMRTAADFVDWNPSHFLDVAEMTAALGLGYDWLHDAMTPEDRVIIRRAIINKGLEPGLSIYRKNEWWTVSPSNWNNVCNGGLIIGALAVADEEPDISKKIIAYALKSLPRALATYASDGSWPEGPMYWEYATRYTLMAAYALRSAIGTDMGVMEHTGINQTGYYPWRLTGPTGNFFNFADSTNKIAMRTCLYGLAGWYNNPAYAYMARKAPETSNITALDLIWFDAAGSLKDAAVIPLDVCYSRIGVAALRSSWTDSDAMYVGFKAGSNDVSHAHLDLGSFVLDADGVRWASDLGPDDYDLPYYFVYAKRWDYYRVSTTGHNTLTINGTNQQLKATAPITKFISDEDHSFAIADLTKAYETGSVKRGIMLQKIKREVVVRDEIELKEPADVVWAVHTYADVSIDADGSHAALTHNGKTMNVYLLSPVGARFTVEDIKLDKPFKPLDVKKLMVKLSEKIGKAQIEVLFSPISLNKLPEVAALDAWK